MFSAMLLDAYRDKQPGIRITYRTDGHLLNSRRMQPTMHVSTDRVHELLFADDCVLNTVTEEEMHQSMDLFAAGCANFGLTISTAKTVVMHQPPPSAEYDASRINVNGAQLKDVETFAYLGSTLSRNTRIDDVQGRRLDDTPLRSGDFDRLLEPSQETESIPSQLPPHNTEAEVARQDPGHGSPEADQNPQHPRHAEASATAMERPPGENGRRVTTQTTFLRRFRYGCSPTGRSKTTLQGHLKKSLKQLQINPATWQDIAQDRPAWRRSMTAGSQIYEANRIATTKAKKMARTTPAPRTNTANAQALPACPRC
ncbi:unnamed protein product [Schistocephalus solidus]|uniref:Reverse transcriptase domain-containing protein n=1 Tax=Schistocephalus solidus TaxID=70667 RepID=A0A183TS49_SCHSO|nr:unnamed protein product [Schistocephalus solidus]